MRRRIQFAPRLEPLDLRLSPAPLLGAVAGPPPVVAATDDPLPDPEPAPGPYPGDDPPIDHPELPPSGPVGPGLAHH